MRADTAFFSFIGIDDPSRHHEYNAWHQLDHLPENMLLDEVVWGDRWVSAPDCAALTTGSDNALTGSDYVVMYWLRTPPAGRASQWAALANRSIHWGRRPELAWASRHPLGFFDPVHGWAAPRVLVSPDAVPARPHRGIHLTVTRVAEPQSPDAVEMFGWYDRNQLPALVSLPGVAGAWSLSFSGGAQGFGTPAAGGAGGELQLRILYLDGDPLPTAERIADQRPPADLSAAEEVLFSGPLRAISPWEWDWFEQEAVSPS